MDWCGAQTAQTCLLSGLSLVPRRLRNCVREYTSGGVYGRHERSNPSLDTDATLRKYDLIQQMDLSSAGQVALA